jgi:hypothetical protein
MSDLNDEKEEMMAECRNMAQRCERLAAQYTTNSRARSFLQDWRTTLSDAASAMAMVDLETDWPKK